MRSSIMSSRNGCKNLGLTTISGPSTGQASTAEGGTLGRAYPPWGVENTIDTLVPRL
jgi:hypothetical protein